MFYLDVEDDEYFNQVYDEDDSNYDAQSINSDYTSNHTQSQYSC